MSPTLSVSPASTAPSLRWLSPLLRAAGAALVILPFLPPLLALAGKLGLAEKLDGLFVGMCHRMPERTISLGGELMPLCSRCLGIVEGAGLGLLIGRPYYGLRVLRITVSIAAALLFIELTTQDLGWHPVFHPTRLLSGFLVAYPLGAAASALARLLGAASSSTASLPDGGQGSAA